MILNKFRGLTRRRNVVTAPFSVTETHTVPHLCLASSSIRQVIILPPANSVVPKSISAEHRHTVSCGTSPMRHVTSGEDSALLWGIAEKIPNFAGAARRCIFTIPRSSNGWQSSTQYCSEDLKRPNESVKWLQKGACVGFSESSNNRATLGKDYWEVRATKAESNADKRI